MNRISYWFNNGLSELILEKQNPALAFHKPALREGLPEGGHTKLAKKPHIRRVSMLIEAWGRTVKS